MGSHLYTAGQRQKAMNEHSEALRLKKSNGQGGWVLLALKEAISSHSMRLFDFSKYSMHLQFINQFELQLVMAIHFPQELKRTIRCKYGLRDICQPLVNTPVILSTQNTHRLSISVTHTPSHDWRQSLIFSHTETHTHKHLTNTFQSGQTGKINQSQGMEWRYRQKTTSK